MLDYLSSWYEVCEGDTLEQGDILFNVPIFEIPEDFEWSEGYISQNDEFETPELEVSISDVIILTQSCDLEQGKITQVLLCKIWALDEHPEFPKSDVKKLNLLVDGNLIHFHLLDKCEIQGFERGMFVVEFKNIYSLPLHYLRKIAVKQNRRLRLKSPYKEHLSQAFARVFMRVGLPSIIPRFEDTKKKKK